MFLFGKTYFLLDNMDKRVGLLAVVVSMVLVSSFYFSKIVFAGPQCDQACSYIGCSYSQCVWIGWCDHTVGGQDCILGTCCCDSCVATSTSSISSTTSSIPAGSCCCSTSHGYGCLQRTSCEGPGGQGSCVSSSCQPCPPTGTTSSTGATSSTPASGNCCCPTNQGNICLAISDCTLSTPGDACQGGAIQCTVGSTCSPGSTTSSTPGGNTTSSTSGSTTSSTSGATCDQNTACAQDGSLNDPKCCTDFPLCTDKRCCKPADYNATGHPEQCCYGLKSDGVHCAAQPCTNQMNSAYGNKICRGDASADSCNWPSGTETVTKRQTDNGVWQINFTSTSTSSVNVFVLYGRIIAVSQPNWKTVGYAKPEVCPQDSYESICNPQLLGTHNYCNFKLPSSQLIADLSTPSAITASTPARAIMPLPLSNMHSASITVSITDEAKRRGIPAVVYYQFNKNLTGSNYYSGCVAGTACNINDCSGLYTGCSFDTIGIKEVLCVRTQTSNVQMLPACWHSPWESTFWDTVNLTSNVAIPLNCSICYAGSKCNCTVNGCSAGTWTVKNTTYPPAIETVTSNIPPATIEFTPTAAGSLEVNASCTNPQQTNKTTVDVRVVTNMVACPSSCYVGKECECQISGCNIGTFIVSNSFGTVKTLTIPPVVSSIKFIPNSTGTFTVTGVCSDPQRGPNVANVSVLTSNATNVTSTTTTSSATTTIELKDCPGDCCIENSTYKEKSCPQEGQECVNNKCQGGSGGGGSTLLIAILVIAVLVGAYFLYFFVLKKRTKLTYNMLYQRWPAKPRRY